MSTQEKRGSWGALCLSHEVSEALEKRFPGDWIFGIETDQKMRGEAVNWSCYALAPDPMAPEKELAIIQTRRWRRTTAKQKWPEMAKDYFLVGVNENGTAFAHPVSHAPCRSVISKGGDSLAAILATEKWIWGVPYDRVVRQGDFGMVPVAARKANKATKTDRTAPYVFDGSHSFAFDEAREDGSALYLLNPVATHLKDEHPVISGEGWFHVVRARTAPTWDFAPPTID